MKLPKWLVSGLLVASVLAVLGFGAWWWAKWPERTLRTFVAFIEDGNLEAANAMLWPPTHDKARVQLYRDDRVTWIGSRTQIGDSAIDCNGMQSMCHIVFFGSGSSEEFVKWFHESNPHIRQFIDIVKCRASYDIAGLGLGTSRVPSFQIDVERNHLDLRLQDRMDDAVH
jgi:hypothetical protein